MDTLGIQREVRAVFDPVAKQLGLRGPIVSPTTQTDFRLTYSGDEIGVEADVELTEFGIYVMLFRAKGRPLPVNYTDEAGRRQLWYLEEVLKHLGIDVSQETKELQGLARDYHNCTRMAELEASLLVEHWAAITSKVDEWSKA